MPSEADRIDELLRLVAQVAAGDFSEKPPLPEGTGPLDRLAAGLRFMMDDLERARDARQRELERLQAIDRMKSQFVNNAAHELATPLTSMRLQLEVLRFQAGSLPPEAGATLESIERNAQHLVRLSRDLLDASRIEDGALQLHVEPIRLDESVAAALESLRPIADQKQVRLLSNVGGPIEALVDAQRLTQVLFNLIHNAIKFTPSGGCVEVTLRTAGREALFQVQDDGLGLAPDDLPKLFRPFSQVHDTHRSEHGGNGLGLFICRGIVERHGGRVWAESHGPRRGATFSFTLPL